MTILRTVLWAVLVVYLLLLIGRWIFDILQSFSRSWRATGAVAIIAEVIYTATDPPLRFLRRYIRPVQIGSVALDLSFTVLIIVILVLLQVVVPLL